MNLDMLTTCHSNSKSPNWCCKRLHYEV